MTTRDNSMLYKKYYTGIALLACALVMCGVLFASGCKKKKKEHHHERETAAAIENFTNWDHDPWRIELHGISPYEGPSTGGTPVTIRGSHFYPGLTASVGGQELQNISITFWEIQGVTAPGMTSDPSDPGLASVNVGDPIQGVGKGMHNAFWFTDK